LAQFESLIDRIIKNKEKSSQSLNLHTNYESTRILTLTGEKLKLYSIEEEENILTNNNSEYFRYEGEFKEIDTDTVEKIIRLMWKTLNDEKSEKISIEKFKYVISINIAIRIWETQFWP
jgi:hypothetical protein